MAELATAARTDALLKVRKIGTFLGAEITGINLSRPLDDTMVRAIDCALARGTLLP